jgi:DNA-binding XRE family transcriptional regulator
MATCQVGMELELARKIGAAARAARTALGRSQADTAEEIGISSDFYARIERGGTMPSVPTLVRMASALKVTTDVLLGLDKRPVPRAEPQDSPELRLLLRRARNVSSRSLRLLCGLAGALETRERSTTSRRRNRSAR